MTYEGREYLTATESAEYLGISRETFSGIKKKYEIPSYHLDKTARKFILKDDLEEYKKTHSASSVFCSFFNEFLEKKNA